MCTAGRKCAVVSLDSMRRGSQIEIEAFVWAWVHPGPCSNPSCLCKRWYARALIALGRPTCIHTSSHLLTPPSLWSDQSVLLPFCALSFSLTPTEWCCQGCLACQKILFGFAGLFLLYAYFVLLLVFRCLWAARALWISLFCPKLNWALVKFPHPLSFLYTCIESDLIGEEMEIQRINPLFCKSEGFILLPSFIVIIVCRGHKSLSLDGNSESFRTQDRPNWPNSLGITPGNALERRIH